MVKSTIYSLLLTLLSISVTAQTFSDSPGTAIPDDASQNCYDITVSGVGTINSTYGLETVCIDISHTWAGDLDIYLVAPDGTTIELTTDNGGSSNNYTNTCFEAGAATSITAGTAPFTGTFAPEGNLYTANNGQDADGTWQLCITDDTGGDSGTLNSWDISFTNNPATTPPPTEQDCDGAIPVCQDTYSNTNSYNGTGNITNEINSSSSCLGSGELNDVWYIFTVQQSGNLNFDIIPVTKQDDYDWALYDVSSSNCSDIYTDPSLEVSCNFSGVTGPPGDGSTGATGGSASNSQGASGSPNNAEVAVTAGQTFVLNISNFSSTQDGYTLDFSNSSAVIYDNIPPELTLVQTPIACGETSISFEFSENILCSTIEDADFTLSGPGGPYTISNVSGSACSQGGTFENSFTATISPAITTSGTYTLDLVTTSGSVTDNCGNVAPAGNIDFVVAGITADITSSTNVSCNGGSNGTATASGSGGSSPYTYSWDDPSSQTTANATGLSAGFYTVTVTDNSGCSGTDTITITEPDPIVLSASGTDETCANQNDGTATVSVTSGGTPNYTYSWNSTPAQTTATATNLPDATYTITVTDANGCSETADVTINAGTVITADPSTSANACLSVNNISFTNNGSSGGGITYSWDFGDGSGTSTTENPSYTYSSVGTFTVSQTVSNGSCSDTETTTVTIYADPSASATATDMDCNGVCDGSIDLTVSGGAPSYTYAWDNGAGTSQDPTGLCANTFSVTVTDNNGCTATASATVGEPDVLTATITASSNIDCDGDDDGTATVSASGGTTAYTYLWDDPAAQTTATATGLDAGTYNVTVTDANGCTATTSVTITEPDPLVITTTPTNLTCNGDGTGDIDATVTGGTTNYTYSWSNSATTQDLTDVAAGTYTLTVTDANGCTETASETITQPDALAITLTPTNPTCNGGTNGSITSTVTGGTTAYSYSWDDPSTQTTANAIGLVAGTYTLTVTDASGCTETASATLTQPTAISVTVTGTDPSCNGVCDGTASTSASGGTGTLTYAWDNGAGNNANASSLCGGTTYTVTVTDDNGCTQTGSFTPTEPTAISLSTSGNDASCNGDCDGDATATASGGTGTLVYSWDDPSFQSTATATALCAGTFNVTVTDDNGCSETDSYTIGEPAVITLTGSSSDATCGNANGSATVSASGGAGSFTYLWDDPATQTTATATGLNSGAYDVTVTDANGCTETLTVNVSDSGGPTASITASTNLTCNGAGNGDATVTAAGGTSPYTYLWNDGGAQTTATATGLAAGNYSVTVTDNIGCTTSASITITQPTVLNASITASSNIDCDGDDDGTATVSASGGTTAYTYLWDDPAAQTTATATGLDAGTYNVTVTDANGCTATTSVTITEPDPLVITTTPTNLTCNGDGTGDIDATVTGGTTNYTYSWSNSATTQDLTDVAAGTYTLTVTDANGCTETASETITQPDALAITLTPTNPTCNGGTNGSITSTVTGGTTAYSYSWDDPSTQTTANAIGLVAGTYTLTVTDASGCTETASATLTQPTAISVTVTGTDPSCNGVCDGTASTSASGGTGTLTYAWDNGAGNNANASSLCGGTTYTVTVTDDNGCTQTGSFTPTEPTAISLSTSGNDASCNGDCDGDATATASGGTGTLVYSWDDPSFQSTATATALCAGTFNVTVTDDNGCSETDSYTIGEPAVITLTGSSSDATCGNANGSATVSASGGAGSFTYLWDDPATQTTATATGLNSGAYDVTVTDANGCTETLTVNVSDSGGPTASITASTNLTCNGAGNGDATVTAAGGTSPYTYLWNDGGAQTTATATGLAAGNYSVTVTDNIGCTTSASVTITQPTVLNASITASSNIDCDGDDDGTATVSASGGTTAYTYLWDDPAAQTTATATGLDAGTYNVTVTDANGCTATASVTITEPDPIVITTTPTNLTCNGDGTGDIDASITGGTTNYTYSWSNSATTQDLTDVAAGTYTLTVTDANGCTETASETITQPTAISLTASSTNASCNSVCDATGTAVASGGTTPLTYLWNDGAAQTTANATGLCGGSTYQVTVTDANGCTATASISPTAPTGLSVSTSFVATSCNGTCDGTAVSSATGGTTPYSFAWNDPAFQTNDSALNVCAGTYNVTVTDANGCTATNSITVTEPNAITLSGSSTDATCGAATGSATITASGGNGSFTYLWDDGSAQTTATATSLTAGAYTVTVTDANGCSNSLVVNVSDAGAPTATISTSTNVDCFGNNNGSATVVAAGGSSPYTYLWNDGSAQTTDVATGLTAGTYSITVTDNVGCSANASVTITQPTALNAAIASSLDPTCFGDTYGSINTNISGGTTAYTYLWDDAAGQTTANATGLGDGTYTLTITDANGCSTTVSATLTEPTDLTVTSVITDVTCPGDADGAIDITVAGGNGSNSYSWDNSSSSEDLNGLAGGTYNVTVTDSEGCTVTLSNTVNENSPIDGTFTTTNSSCGQNNGSATVTASGGDGTYTYLWNDPSAQTTATANNLTAGSYNVIITDGNGCSDTFTVTVSDSGGGTASIASTSDETCFNVCDGYLVASMSGGLAPYTYLWDDATSSTNDTLFNACQGSYSVTITDANGCSSSATGSIGGPTEVVIAIDNLQDVLCNNGTSGAIDISVSGGTSPYSYSWSNSLTNQDLTGLADGSYTVTVTDANGCSADSTIAISEPTPIVITNDATTNPTCFGDDNGAIDISVSGGTPVYTYSWNNGASQTSEDASGLSSGSYTITVTDANGCSQTSTSTLTEPTQLVASSSSTDANCGNANGTATITGTGGTGSYTYLWNDASAQTTSTATGLLAGTYWGYVTDANGCTDSSQVVIGNGNGPTATISNQNNVSCFGDCNGNATLDVNGGNSPYTYSWDDPASQTTLTASNLCAGTYTATVTDANGCQTTVSVTISEPNDLTLSLSASDETCTNSCDGSIITTVTGGTSSYTYLWNNGSSSTSADLTNSCPGTFGVTVTDANGCTVSDNATIGTPDFSIATSTLNANCGNSDGSATVNVVTGTAPFSYLWNDPASQTTATATNLSSGNYSVTVTDSAGCTLTAQANVSDAGGPTLSINSTTDPDCYNGSNGSATISATGGTSPYTYLWSDAAAQTTATAINLSAGTYSVEATDNLGCSASIDVTINNPTEVAVSVVSTTPESCEGSCNGSALVTVTGGSGNYSYLWNDPASQTTALATGLCEGSFTVDVFDDQGCTDNLSVNIGSPAGMTLTMTSTEATCFSDCDGAANVSVTGGTAPYSFLWDDPAGQTTATANNLCSGNYNITVTDNNGCTASDAIMVNEPTNIAINLSAQGAESCLNSCNGYLTVSASGGSGSYTYAWDDSNSQTGTTASNLCGGDYTVTVTDGNGCTQSSLFTVNSSPSFTATIANDTVSCSGSCDGTLAPSISGGTAPFTYLWNDGSLQTDSTANNLCVGTYNVIITDVNGCSTNANGTVIDQTPLSLNSSTTPANCGNADGIAVVSIASGNGPFTYLWNDASSQTTATASSLTAGTYQVVVSDANGCQDSVTVNVNNNGSPTLTILSQNNPVCYGDSTGSVSLTINGGTAPFTTLWNDDNAQSTITASGLPAGTYTATVTDNNGCSANISATLTQPTAMNVAISNKVNNSCYNSCDGSATVIINSGTAPYSYAWTDINNQTTATASSLCAGTYTVTVSDANGCSAQVNTTITEPSSITTSITGDNTTCSLNNGSATVTASGGSGNYTYLWNDANSQTGSTANNLLAGEYVVTVSDVNNCTINDTITLTNNNPQNLTLSNLIDESCFESNDGLIAVSVSGMAAPLSFLWNDPATQTTSQASNLAAGTYNLTVTGANGCSIDTSFSIQAATQIVPSLSVTQPACNNSCDGAIDISVSGGVPNYNYVWSSPSLPNSGSVSGLCPNTYTVTISDQNGCEVDTSIVLNNPAPMSINSTASNANCGNADGTITTNVSNGTSPYTYQWNDPFSQTNATATGLEAGSYVVIATDANGCTISDTVQVIDLDGPTVYISNSQNVSCYGGNNGFAMVSIDGGEEPFAYIWNDANNQTNNLASNLSAGTYTVTISDANNCSGAATVTISQPDSIEVFLSGIEPLCNNECNGSISANVIGGTAPYNYLWNDGASQTTSTAQNLCEGDYEVTVTDNNGCYAIVTYELNEPAFLTGGITTTETSCSNSCDGSASVNAVGGTSPYTYAWNDSNSQSGTNASNLCGGAIEVTITDANGCEVTLDETIDSPTPVGITFANVTPLSCYQSCDGSAEAVPSGGTAPYTYLWNDAAGQTSATLSNVCIKQYEVTVTDANGCSNSATVNITQPQPLVATASGQNTSCYQSCDGTATGAASGGTSPYTYLWNDNALQSTITATNLCAGNYTVTVTDTNNCTAVANVTIQEPSQIGVNFNITQSNCGNNNGQANAAVTGGTGPFTYQWNDGNNQTTSIAYNLYAGPYTLTVSDANGCQHTENINVIDIEAPTVTLIDSNHVSCYQAGDGTATISVVGGVPSYTIAWDDPANQNTALAANLDGGIYTVTVTDAAGCISAVSVEIDEPLNLTTAIAGKIDASCFGSCDGSANAVVGGGTAPYSYLWNDPASTTTSNVNNLCAGLYGVLVTDNNGCTASTSVLIKEPTELMLNAIVSNVNCYEDADGSIAATVTGGTPGYLYSWVPSGNSGSFATGLDIGDHFLTVTDAKGCVISNTYTITQPPLLTVASTSFPATCDEDNGSANAIPNGGTPGYTYSWVPNVGTQNTVSFLSPGQYTVTVTDANGCEETRDITVYEIPSPSIEGFITTNTTCSGGSDGTSHVIVKNAVEPMLFNWSPSGGTDSLAFNLSAGTYTVTLTDGNGCTVSASTVVGSPDPVRIITDGETTICYGQTTEISGTAFGGNGGYTYTWNDPSFSNNSIQNVSPLTTTTYNLFATDVYGCVSDFESITVTVNPPLEVVATAEGPICLNDSTLVSAQASAGNGGPYYYTWNTLDTTNTFYDTPNQSFDYIVTASDSCSIDAMDTVNVIVNPNPVVDFDSDVVDGCVSLTVGFENQSDIGFEYLWEFGNGDSSTFENPVFEYDAVGSYDVSLTVTSIEGCTSTLTDSTYITVHELPTAYFTPYPTLTTVLAPDVYFTDASTDAISYSWNFGDPDTTYNSNTSEDQNPMHSYMNPGVYVVTETVTNEFGCIDTHQDSIYVEEGFIIFFPNAFSPNGDGENDVWRPVGTGINSDNYEMWIFDRWGNLIFHTEDPDKGWDGIVQNKGKEVVQEDVYVWKVRLRDTLDEDHNYVGHVTVVK